MVLQSVTHAVTRPMGRLRRGCLVSESGLRLSLAFLFLLVLTSRRVEPRYRRTRRLPFLAWSMGPRVKLIGYLPSTWSLSSLWPITISHVSLAIVIFTRHCLQSNPFFSKKARPSKGWKFWLPKTQQLWKWYAMIFKKNVTSLLQILYVGISYLLHNLNNKLINLS